MGAHLAELQLPLRSKLRFLPTGHSIERVQWLFFVIFYSVLANIPYWVASRELGFLDGRGLFCVSFIAVGLLALFIRPVLSAALFFVVIVADLVWGVCESYFLSINDCLGNLVVFHSLAGSRKVATVAVALLAFLIASASLFLREAFVRKGDRWRTATCLLAFGASILLTDVIAISSVTGNFPTPLRLVSAIDGINRSIPSVPRLARISMTRLVRSVFIDARIRSEEKRGAASISPVPSAAAEALRRADLTLGKSSQELPNLVIIVVESWGLAKDLSLRQGLDQPYSQPGIRDRYEVVRGTVPFYGATIAGEARELCGTSIGYHLINAAATELKDCLPAHLAGLGYRNIAVHGMNRHVFSRSSWYRTIGFQEQWFNDQLKQQGLADCVGAFVGTCDADVAKWIGGLLAKDATQPYFVHWMTLNSHLPVPFPLAHPVGSPCLATMSLTPDSPLCSWFQLITNVNESVSEIAMGELSRPTVFVIVGDHAPPFVDPAMRDRFSETVVPYVLLIPSQVHNSRDRLLARSSLNQLGKATRSYAQTP